MEAKNNVEPPPALTLTFPTRGDIGESRYKWTSCEIQSQLPINVLLFTVEDHEFRSCYCYMKQIKRSWCDGVGMVDFGEFGAENVRVALIRSKEGPINAALVVKNSAEILNPKVLLFVGYCATVNPTKAKLGDVVISSKLATYSNKKITADGIQELHGIKTNVSRRMAELILCASDGWNPPLEDHTRGKEVKIHLQAVVISGSEVIENRERREELLKRFPDAIGLENEGEGLYAAAHDLGIEWAVIKGISDFADGIITATDEWRLFASAMAASVVYHMFKYPDVTRQWSHYRRTEQEDAETEVLGANLSLEIRGGTFSFKLIADCTRVVRDLCVTAVSLGTLYFCHQLLRPLIEYAVQRGLGGERDDQEFLGVNPGSLHVLLRCLTNERFLEVLEDFETGIMKDRLLKEFSKEEIEIDGLKVEIENMEEVYKTKAAINKRLFEGKNGDIKEISKDLEEQDRTPDIFIVHHENYITVRDAFRKAILTSSIDDLDVVIQDIKAEPFARSCYVLLALFREVTTSLSYVNREDRISTTVLEKLRQYITRIQYLPNELKPLAENLLTNFENASSQLLQLNQNGIDGRLIEVLVHFRIVMECLPQNQLLQPLRNLAFNPAVMTIAFIPTMPHDYGFEAMQANVGRWYECPNGHLYVITECGLAITKYICPTCHAPIGGESHTLLSDNREASKQDRSSTGHILGRAEAQQQYVTSERNLTPLACGILRCFTHAAMLLGADQNIQSIAAVIKPPVQDVVQFLLEHLRHDIRCIARNTGKNDDEAMQIIHLVLAGIVNNLDQRQGNVTIQANLSTTDSRAVWENAFMETYLNPVLSDVSNLLQDCLGGMVRDERLRK